METAAAFKDYVDESFPVGGKRTRSAVIRQSYADRDLRTLSGCATGLAGFTPRYNAQMIWLCNAHKIDPDHCIAP